MKMINVICSCILLTAQTNGQKLVEIPLSESEIYSGIHGGYVGNVDIVITSGDMCHPTALSPYSQIPAHRSKAIFYSTKSALMKRQDIRIPDRLLGTATTSTGVAAIIREGNNDILSRIWVFKEKVYITQRNEKLDIFNPAWERCYDSNLRAKAFKVYEFTTPALVLGGTGVATLKKSSRFAKITLEVFLDEELTKKVAGGCWQGSTHDLSNFPAGKVKQKYFIKVSNPGDTDENYQLHVHSVDILATVLALFGDEMIKAQLVEMGFSSRTATHLKTAFVSSFKDEEKARMFLKMTIAEQRMLLKDTLGYDKSVDYFLKYLIKYYFGIFKHVG